MFENKNLAKLWGNDAKRKNFIEAYREWGIWFTTPELGLTWYRYRMPDETTIIAMEYEQETYTGYQGGYELKPTIRYYIQQKGKPFSPNTHSSIWGVADLLKKAKLSVMNIPKNSTDKMGIEDQ